MKRVMAYGSLFLYFRLTRATLLNLLNAAYARAVGGLTPSRRAWQGPLGYTGQTKSKHSKVLIP